MAGEDAGEDRAARSARSLYLVRLGLRLRLIILGQTVQPHGDPPGFDVPCHDGVPHVPVVIELSKTDTGASDVRHAARHKEPRRVERGVHSIAELIPIRSLYP